MEETLDEFYQAFKEEGQTFEDYVKVQHEAFDEAKAAGEIPENTFTVDIPDSPDTCAHLTDVVESEIAQSIEKIKQNQDETNYIIHEICSNLGETVTQIIEENMTKGHEVSERLGLILQDIAAVEGGQDPFQLEMKLREEYVDDPDAVMIESSIKLPSEAVPMKCAH